MPAAFAKTILVGVLASVTLLIVWRSLDLTIYPNHLPKRGSEHGWAPNFTTSLLGQQWVQPGQITTILLLVGGEVIQKAVAQMAGTREHPPFTPVVFSYGWVSYAFILLANAIGNTSYLPPPDYPGKIISVKSGDKREIRSWFLARLLRDLEHEIDPDGQISNHRKQKDIENIALYVAVYQIDRAKMRPSRIVESTRDFWWWSFLIPLVLQLAVASIPILPTPGRTESNYYILLITVAGNVLAFLTGSLQSSREEKFGLRTKLGCRDMFAITRGNGHNIVFIILPDSFDKREGERGDAGDSESKSHLPYLAEMATLSYRPTTGSRIRAVFFTFLWIALLVTIGGSTSDTWCLLVVGAVGMIHAIVVAGVHRKTEAHGIPLIPVPEWTVKKDGVRKALTALESFVPGAGYMLRGEFFNGPERPDDLEKWRDTMTIQLNDQQAEIATQDLVDSLSPEDRANISIKQRREDWKVSMFGVLPGTLR
ncbi:hypothetical protein V8F06_005551 [Rhypophila decipiens]